MYKGTMDNGQWTMYKGTMDNVQRKTTSERVSFF